VNKTFTKFSSFAEPEKADREFYKKLSGNGRSAGSGGSLRFSALVLFPFLSPARCPGSPRQARPVAD